MKNKEIIVIKNNSFSKNKIKKTFIETPLEHIDLVYNSFLISIKEIKDTKEIISRLSSAYNGICLKLENINTSAINDIKNLYDMKINLLELKNKYLNDLLKEKNNIINYINPSLDEYNVINIHPFTCNKRNYWNSPIYQDWKNKFPKQDVKTSKKIDFTKPVNIWLKFDHLDKFDVTNLSKTAIDLIIAVYKVKDRKADDKLIQLRNCSTNKIVDNYEDGKIYYKIEQGKIE